MSWVSKVYKAESLPPASANGKMAAGVYPFLKAKNKGDAFRVSMDRLSTIRSICSTLRKNAGLDFRCKVIQGEIEVVNCTEPLSEKP